MKTYRYLLALIALCSVATTNVFAHGNSDWQNRCNEIRLHPMNGLPAFMKFKLGQEMPPAEFAEWAKTVFSRDGRTSYELIRRDRDQIGMEHFRFQQLHNGHPVLGGHWILHTVNGLVTSANGHFIPVPNGIGPVLLDESAAFQKALNAMPASSYVPMFTTGRGTLAYAPVNADFEAADIRLCWKFDIYSLEPLARADVYIDAGNGTLVFKNPTMHEVDVQGTVVTKYSGAHNMVTDSTGSGYRLRETGRGGGIETYNMMEGNNVQVFTDFTDADNAWNNVNAAQDEVAGDVHWGSEMVYDYFFQKHSLDSYDGLGTVVLGMVHYNANWSNARWDGQRMLFGDGGGANSPLTTLDILAHEFTHGVTRNSSNLIYANESGALNESYSDIFGVSAENFTIPDSGNWLLGEQCIPGAIRNMENPNTHSDPDTYFGTNWWTTAFDNYGVHTNSGVQNFWYYLLVEGGTGTNDIGDAYAVNSIGWDTAAAIAFRTNSFYLTPASPYADARAYSIQSAIDIYGFCSDAMEQTTNAWYAVGVGGRSTDTAQAGFAAVDTVICDTALTVEFLDQSTNALTIWWDFGDGNSSILRNPTHNYASNGTYTVTQIVSTCSGSDTLIQTGFIRVDQNILCPNKMPYNADTSFTSCNGLLTDNGGSANYRDNSVSRTTITVPSGNIVTLTFSLFEYALGGDYIGIYDGPDDQSPVIGLYNGTTLPNGGVVTSTGNLMTIKEVTNNTGNFAGFEATWDCRPVAVEAALEKADFRLSPNPSFADVTLHYVPFGMSEVQIEIRDVTGRLVYEQGLNAGQVSDLRLPVQNWDRGLYFVRIREAGKAMVRKMVLL